MIHISGKTFLQDKIPSPHPPLPSEDVSQYQQSKQTKSVNEMRVLFFELIVWPEQENARIEDTQDKNERERVKMSSWSK